MVASLLGELALDEVPYFLKIGVGLEGMDDAEEKDLPPNRGEGHSREVDSTKPAFRDSLVRDLFFTPVVYALSRTPWLESDDKEEFRPVKEIILTLMC